MPGSSIAGRFETVRRRIAKACRIAGRDPAGVGLTAVTKTQAAEALSAALEAGQRVFGENRVQEAQAHWSELRQTVPGLELRLIGPHLAPHADALCGGRGLHRPESLVQRQLLGQRLPQVVVVVDDQDRLGRGHVCKNGEA